MLRWVLRVVVALLWLDDAEGVRPALLPALPLLAPTEGRVCRGRGAGMGVSVGVYTPPAGGGREGRISQGRIWEPVMGENCQKVWRELMQGASKRDT